MLNETSVFHVKNADIIGIHNPQIQFGSIQFSAETVEITPELVGRYTVFIELRKDNVSWYHPLELTVDRPWTIPENYQAWTKEQPACQLLPKIDDKNKTLHFEIKNNRSNKVSGSLEVEIQAKSMKSFLSIDTKQKKRSYFHLKRYGNN
ncbi:MAG: hypothetical protein ACYTBJ_10320 [Planctomycetota bacterium]|jgi:hypothetical protein